MKPLQPTLNSNHRNTGSVRSVTQPTADDTSDCACTTREACASIVIAAPTQQPWLRACKSILIINTYLLTAARVINTYILQHAFFGRQHVLLRSTWDLVLNGMAFTVVDVLSLFLVLWSALWQQTTKTDVCPSAVCTLHVHSPLFGALFVIVGA